MPHPATGGPRSRARILQAAVDLCAEESYAAATMEAIAARARVGKPTLYRWWPSRGALILDAMMDALTEPYLILPNTGDMVADVHTWVRSFLDLFSDPRLRALCIGVIGAAQHSPEVKSLLLERVHDPARVRNQARIREAQQAGQLDDRLDPQLFEDALIGPLWYRVLISDAPLTQDYAESLVELLVGEPRKAGTLSGGRAGARDDVGR